LCKWVFICIQSDNHIKWCNGFLDFSLKECFLSLLNAFLDVVIDGYSVVRIGAGILVSLSVDLLIGSIDQ
jgi:hypothetical protein